MLFNNTMGQVSLPLMQVADGGGGNAGGNAGGGGNSGGGSLPNTSQASPSGARPGPDGQSAQRPQQQNTPQGGTPTANEPVDWDGKRLYRVPGRKDPITGEEYVRGFQSQFTKASQEAAKLKKDLAARDQELQRIRGTVSGQPQDPGASQGAQMLGEIENAPFIDGKMMGNIIRDFQAGTKERDMVILGALNKLQQIEQVLGQLHGVHLNQSHEAKLKTWLTDAGLGDDQDAFELADIIYRGYEGDNLDQEFPEIFKQRWGQMQNAVQRRLSREREQRRQLPFTPGRGGNAGPGKPQGLTGRESAKQLADIFFERYNGQSGT